MSRSPFWRVLCALVLALSVCAPAYANSIWSNLTFNTAPVYWVNTAGDAFAPPEPGTVPVGYKTNNPGAHDWRLDYGLHYRFNQRFSLYYTHDVLDYNLDRAYFPVPGTKREGSFVSGDAGDRIDQAGFSYVLAQGLVGRLYYLDHERYMVSGFCLNQVSCGGGAPNPNVGDMHGYALGATYGFGPHTIVGPLLSASLDAQYIPRPAEAPMPTDNPNSNGLSSWPGSKVIYPYAITATAPFLAKNPTFIGFVGYSRAAEYFRNNASQNLYNVVTFGVVKTFNKNLSVSLTNLNYKECTCSDTVPPPENLRAAGMAMKIDYAFNLAPVQVKHP
jgi:hypothetical protein